MKVSEFVRDQVLQFLGSAQLVVVVRPSNHNHLVAIEVVHKELQRSIGLQLLIVHKQ